MEKQRPVDDLAVFQLLQPDSGNTGFAPQDDAVQMLFFTRRKDGVHQPEKALLPDGLELVKVGPHRIGLHCKLRRGGQKNDFYVVVKISDL